MGEATKIRKIGLPCSRFKAVATIDYFLFIAKLVLMCFQEPQVIVKINRLNCKCKLSGL